MKRTPWMPLYCDDLIGSTADMSAEEFGAYMRLLCHLWSRGPLPCDETVICRIAGIRRAVWRRISSRFSPVQRSDGTVGLSQRRLEAERMARLTHSERKSESGRRGANARWQTHRIANGKPMTCHNQIDIPSVVLAQGAAAAPRAAPPVEGGLPRLAAQDPTDGAADRTRAFITAHRRGAHADR